MMFWPVLVLLLGGAIFLILGQLSQRTPAGLGLQDGKLAPLAPTPNGVSSQSSEVSQRIEPWRYERPAAEVRQLLRELLQQEPRARIIEDTERYVHAEFRSRLFRFVDDVEFLIEDGVIQVRSASRVGRSDLGVNRQRMERLHRDFTARHP